MDKSVPNGAAKILELIMLGETAKHPPESYRVIIANKQAGLTKPLTDFTVDELLADQSKWVRRFKVPSTAAGAYQIIRKTLLGLKTSLGLRGTEKFSPDMQDRLGYALLRQRGFDQFVAGKQSIATFAKNLAMEWASMPVLIETQGAHGNIRPGQSYYDGDGINGARVKASDLSAVLAAVKGAPEAAKTGKASVVPVLAFPPGEASSASADTADTILSVQQKLKELGYSEVGKVDGKMGALTETAILAFRKDNNLPLSTAIDDRLLATLLKAPLRELSPKRLDATPKEVRQEVPEARNSFRTKVGGIVATAFSGAGFLISGVFSNLSGARDLVQPLLDVADDIPRPVYFLIIGGFAAWLWWQSHRGEQASVEAYQNAERR